MGIFNEHSNNNTFAKGIQGAPGVGFNLTSDGDYDMLVQPVLILMLVQKSILMIIPVVHQLHQG